MHSMPGINVKTKFFHNAQRYNTNAIMNLHTHTHTHHSHMHMHTYNHTSKHMQKHTYIYIYSYTYTHIPPVTVLHTDTHTLLCTHTDSDSLFPSPPLLSLSHSLSFYSLSLIHTHLFSLYLKKNKAKFQIKNILNTVKQFIFYSI